MLSRYKKIVANINIIHAIAIEAVPPISKNLDYTYLKHLRKAASKLSCMVLLNGGRNPGRLGLLPEIVKNIPRIRNNMPIMYVITIPIACKINHSHISSKNFTSRIMLGQ
jgi:hypothetical protein